jgi:hypothetical protein
MSSFWIGFLAGFFTGGTLVAVILTAFALAKKADLDNERAHEIVDLNHQSSLAPGDPGYVADRFYRESPDTQKYRR